MTDLLRSRERCLTALERVKTLCLSLSLPMSTTVIEAQQWIEEAIPAFPDYPQVESSVETKDEELAALHGDCKQNILPYQKKLVDLKQIVSDRSADIRNIEELGCTVSDIESNFVFSQSKIQEVKKKRFISLNNWKRAPLR